jgi:methionyl-tRNA formyltransferase
MLAATLLALPRHGALNMHGSLLPKFRGRAPVNCAILAGERETGATLHYMTAKPDDGDIVAQTAVPILPDDTAREVFDKVTVAAEMTLDRALPDLIAGNAPRRPQNIAQGRYFRGNRPDGVIWTRCRRSTTSCARSSPCRAPTAQFRFRAYPARVVDADATSLAPALAVRHGKFSPTAEEAGCLCSPRLDGGIVAPPTFAARFGTAPVSLGEPAYS